MAWRLRRDHRTSAALVLAGIMIIAVIPALVATATHGPVTPGTPTGAWAKSPDSPDPGVRFIVTGDTGTGGDWQHRVADAMKAVCDDPDHGCDFVIITGDNIYEVGVTSAYDPQFISKFEQPYAAFDIPFYLTVGNHDASGGPTVAGEHLDYDTGIGSYHANADHQVDYHHRPDRTSDTWNMPDRWYTFTADDQAGDGAVQVFSIDANAAMWAGDPIYTNDPLAVQQGLWLQQEMAASTADWKLVFGHQPYISNGQHGNAGTYNGQHETQEAGDGTLGVFLRTFLETNVCDQADLYLAGHDHDLQWLKPVDRCGDTEFIVSGAGAKDRDISDPLRNPAYFQQGDVRGFFWIEIQGDQLTGKAYTVDASGSQQKVFEQTLTDPVTS